MKLFRLPSAPAHAVVAVPGDKSLSHRALLLAAMARGASRVAKLGPGEDVAATVRALAKLGVTVEGDRVCSPGASDWSAPPEAIDAANSATTLRLLAGALSPRPFRTTLVGDASLMARPMERLVAPLGALGAAVEVGPDGRPPVRVGGAVLHGAPVRVSQASAQVRTAVALAALQAEGPTLIDSPPGFRDHTERWLESMGLGRRLTDTAFEILPGPVPPNSYDLPGDMSAAAFLLAAAALRPGSSVTATRVTLNPGRTGFLDALAAMGAFVERKATGFIHGDPVGDVTVAGARLRGGRVDGPLAARTLDELPLVAVLGAAADGETVVSGAAELRVKESDRIGAVVALVRALGGRVEERADGFVVQGGGLTGGEVDAAGDHRIAMAAAIAAVAADAPVGVHGFEAVAASWPGFAEALEELWS